MDAGEDADPFIDRTLAALGDPTRRRVIELLGEGPARASALAAGARTTRTAMSRHLAVLKQAGLVAGESTPEDARVRIYRLRPGPLRAVARWLRRHQGAPLPGEGFASHLAESRRRRGSS